MLKFVSNNKSGVFELDRSASFLAQTKDAIQKLVEVFSECGIINVLETNSQTCKIEFLSNAEVSKALHTKSYVNFLEELQKTQDFKEFLLESELSSLCN